MKIMGEIVVPEHLTWGVWDRANGRWVGETTKTRDEAKIDADRWNAVYGTTYYVVRPVGFETRKSA